MVDTEVAELPADQVEAVLDITVTAFQEDRMLAVQQPSQEVLVADWVIQEAATLAAGWGRE